MKTPSARPLLTDLPEHTDSAGVNELWKPVRSGLQDAIPEQAFLTWFDPLRPLGSVGGIIAVEVPNRFYYDWIEEHYSAIIDTVLLRTLGSAENMRYVLAGTNGNGHAEREQIAPPAPPSPVATAQVPKKKPSGEENGLNPRYTFKTFIEGPTNRFARAASLSVAGTPGKTSYNPLLIYGGVGLGKTHLLQAIGHEMLRNNPHSRVRYISSERFTQEFVEAIKTNDGDRFSNRYRRVDLLLMDDVQFLVGRDRTLMEFFHIFNDLYQAGKQIVLSSDKPPRELNGLDERLVSRFGWGLVADIEPPDYDTRVAIIEMLAERENLRLPPEVVDLLATRFTKSVRDMQGALIRLTAHASMSGGDIDIQLAKRAIRDLVDSRERVITIELVQRVVAEYFGIAPDLMLAKLRTQPIARARMVAMALCTRLCRLSLKQIGAGFGNRDHTTVMHARETVAKWESEEETFAGEIAALVRRMEAETG